MAVSSMNMCSPVQEENCLCSWRERASSWKTQPGEHDDALKHRLQDEMFGLFKDDVISQRPLL